MKPKTNIGYLGIALAYNAPRLLTDRTIMDIVNKPIFERYTRQKSKGNTKWKQRISNFLKS